MKDYEITFKSCNSVHYAKPITAYVTGPDRMDGGTGLMHFAHGWGGNRYGYRAMQQEFADRYNLIGVATEFRQSGYDFDPVTGTGAYQPYDASHLQVIDCLNAVRHVLGLYPGLDRGRLIAYGGSQGGHISMLMCSFCPDTFALVISACGASHFDAERAAWAGRDFSARELAVRDTAGMAGRGQCPVVLMHGTADETLPDLHTRRMEKALREAGRTVVVKYYEGGNHALGPVTNRRDATVELADALLREARNDREDDFAAGRAVRVPCGDSDFVIDWSRRPEDPELARWEQTRG
ncbi:MAG: DUF2920 family protein [Candidatus Latescibacteria bacterium]|nr:DUF2920 family protein [Candidatus Latescibacterota bacterium]